MTEARIAIDIDSDPTPTATTRVAVAVARQSGRRIEFVAAATRHPTGDAETQVRERGVAAAAAGASEVTWSVVDGTTESVRSYITWSGADLQCRGWRRRRTGSAGGVPLLVVGPRCAAGVSYFRRCVVGLHGPSDRSDHVATVVARFARQLATELVFIEVFVPGPAPADVVESGYLRRVVAGLDHPEPTFDTLQASRTAPGILQFVGDDEGTIIAVGASVHHRRVGFGAVADWLVRHAPCPVLVVPAGALRAR